MTVFIFFFNLQFDFSAFAATKTLHIKKPSQKPQPWTCTWSSEQSTTLFRQHIGGRRPDLAHVRCPVSHLQYCLERLQDQSKSLQAWPASTALGRPQARSRNLWGLPRGCSSGLKRHQISAWQHSQRHLQSRPRNCWKLLPTSSGGLCW